MKLLDMVKWAKNERGEWDKFVHTLTDGLCEDCRKKLDMGYNPTRNCNECKKKKSK